MPGFRFGFSLFLNVESTIKAQPEAFLKLFWTCAICFCSSVAGIFFQECEMLFSTWTMSNYLWGLRGNGTVFLFWGSVLVVVDVTDG